jgi:hypothetical protein
LEIPLQEKKLELEVNKEIDKENRKKFESALNDAIINRSLYNLFKESIPGAYMAPHFDDSEEE